MHCNVRLVGLASVVLFLAGCQCGGDREGSSEGATVAASGQELLLPDRVILAPEAVAALVGAPDGSRSGRVEGVEPALIRMPPERGAITSSTLEGEVRWEADVGRLHPGAVVIDGALIVRGRTASEDGPIQPTLTAVELTTGEVRWRHRDEEALHFGVPTAAGREVYAMRIQPDGCVGVGILDARTGEANDPIETPCLRFVSSAPLELAEASIRPDGEGAVVLGRSEQTTHALVSLGIDGEVRWRVEAALGTQVPVAPVVLSGVVLALDRGVRAIDRDSGELFWHAEMTAREMAVADGRIYVTDGADVRCLDAADGTTRFTVSLPAAGRSPRVHGDLLLVETDTGVHALSTEDGEPRWVYGSADRVSSIAMTEHAVFVATSRQVLRLGLDDGDASVLAEQGGQYLLAVEPLPVP
ncbi:MAG: PQQ-binding-like beta-propeller repeat protein [Sandaracinaceae bacterium]